MFPIFLWLVTKGLDSLHIECCTALIYHLHWSSCFSDDSFTNKNTEWAYSILVGSLLWVPVGGQGNHSTQNHNIHLKHEYVHLYHTKFIYVHYCHWQSVYCIYTCTLEYLVGAQFFNLDGRYPCLSFLYISNKSIKTLSWLSLSILTTKCTTIPGP